MTEQQDAEARGDLTQAMVPVAASLAVAVREETREEIAQRLGSLDTTELHALVVVLAAMVDPDQVLHEALAWVDFDEYGDPARPYVPRKASRWTAREKAAQHPPAAPKVRIDWNAVERALAGHPVELNQSERIAAADVGIRLGMSKEEVGEALGMTFEAVDQAWGRIKKRARAAGVPVPAEPVGQITPHRIPREDAA